ncbi:DUF1294 domain-containing protein [Candidatus Contubernalis alkalaceticus]|uniref:DUF1294 domain-containing protein n=1 Tax=Candidatus Contubernalis alkaliaceticus TaxID=338645 RepID=UPI00387E9731
MEKLATSFLIINIVSFIVLGLDKNRAKTGNWRISERSLFVLAFFWRGYWYLPGNEDFSP